MTQIIEKKPTKIRILDKAKQLMLERGYTATSVDDICKASDVAKGSFFHYFKNKEELGKELIEYFSEQTRLHFESMMGPASSDPLERINAFLACLGKLADQKELKGCLVGTLAQEIHRTHPELQSACSKSMCCTIESLKKDFIEAKKQNCPNAKFDAEGLAELCASVMQGSFVVSKATGDTKVLKGNMAHLTAYIKECYKA